jgi:predicted kinase
VREGHGDLRAEHVIAGEQIEVFDPVEFDPDLRNIDVSADLAFLVMDFERHERGDLTAELLDAYRDAGGDPGDDALLFFYAAYRAWVRAKVAFLRAEQHSFDPDDLARIADLAGVATRLAWRARGPLAFVACGAAATGKTHLARRLADTARLTHVNSDVVRKELLGLAPEQRAPAEAYSAHRSEETYSELGRRAAAVLERGESVIVDATFRSRADRDAFARGYGRWPPPWFIECRAPASVIADRAVRRRSERRQPSDADAQIALEQLASFEALDEVSADRHIVLRTDRAGHGVIDELEAVLDERLFGPGGPLGDGGA